MPSLGDTWGKKVLLCLTLYSRGQDLCLISLHRMPDFCDVILLRVIMQVGPLDCQVEEDSIILGSRHTFRCVAKIYICFYIRVCTHNRGLTHCPSQKICDTVHVVPASCPQPPPAELPLRPNHHDLPKSRETANQRAFTHHPWRR